LIDYGIYLDDEDIRILVRYFDRNGDGVINFDEFLTVIKGPLNEARMQMVRQAYNKLDVNGDGQITL